MGFFSVFYGGFCLQPPLPLPLAFSNVSTGFWEGLFLRFLLLFGIQACALNPCDRSLQCFGVSQDFPKAPGAPVWGRWSWEQLKPELKGRNSVCFQELLEL